MCRHCERLKEDIADAPVIHAFMESLTRAANRKLREQGMVNRVTADDIQIAVRFTGQPPVVVSDDADRARAAMAKLLSEFGEFSDRREGGRMIYVAAALMLVAVAGYLLYLAELSDPTYRDIPPPEKPIDPQDWTRR